MANLAFQFDGKANKQEHRDELGQNTQQASNEREALSHNHQALQYIYQLEMISSSSQAKLCAQQNGFGRRQQSKHMVTNFLAITSIS